MLDATPANGPTDPVATSLLPCCVQVSPDRVNTHTAPTLKLSPGPPTNAVFPSGESVTEVPWPACVAAPVPTSLLPCWVQTPFLRTNTQTAPAPRLSNLPPTRAVVP